MSFKRNETKKIQIGSLTLGGSDEVIVQSMCNIKTSHVDEVSKQINEAAFFGAKLMRVSILDFEDAEAIKEIKRRVGIPLVADIHMNYRLALASLESGVDAIRINPGNIGDEKKIEEVVKAAKKARAPIRIGVNGGSLDKTLLEAKKNFSKGELLFESAKKHIAILQKFGFDDIVLSLKGSDALETMEAYRLAADHFPYPLHLGVTEAGPLEVSLIRSTIALAPLLLEGIGNTIRISLTEDPLEEVKAANRLLLDLGLKKDWPRFISCPTCGRTEVNLLPLAKKVLHYLEEHKINKTVAVMGCAVNGPGEAKNADIGLAGAKGYFVLFKKGKVVRTLPEDIAFETLLEEIEKL